MKIHSQLISTFAFFLLVVSEKDHHEIKCFKVLFGYVSLEYSSCSILVQGTESMVSVVRKERKVQVFLFHYLWYLVFIQDKSQSHQEH